MPSKLLIRSHVVLTAFCLVGCAAGRNDPPRGTDSVIPRITPEPANQTGTVGKTATFSITAPGTAPLMYQWKKNGANISGALSSSYTPPATTTADNGSMFRVTVTNSAGS